MLKSKFWGETMIFAKEYNGRTFYSTSISKKNAQGGFDNGYIDVQFKKGTEIPNKTKITISEDNPAWLTFYTNKDKKTVWQLFIAQYECDSQVNDVPDFAAIDEDIPF